MVWGLGFRVSHEAGAKRSLSSLCFSRKHRFSLYGHRKASFVALFKKENKSLGSLLLYAHRKPVFYCHRGTSISPYYESSVLLYTLIGNKPLFSLRFHGKPPILLFYVFKGKK